MQKRSLGRIGLQVGVIGIGGTWISELSLDSAVQVVRKAIDCGNKYFDSAKLDGDNEEKIGSALKNVRNNCVIATKTGSEQKN